MSESTSTKVTDRHSVRYSILFVGATFMVFVASVLIGIAKLDSSTLIGFMSLYTTLGFAALCGYAVGLRKGKKWGWSVFVGALIVGLFFTGIALMISFFTNLWGLSVGILSLGFVVSLLPIGFIAHHLHKNAPEDEEEKDIEEDTLYDQEEHDFKAREARIYFMLLSIFQAVKGKDVNVEALLKEKFPYWNEMPEHAVKVEEEHIKE